MPTIVGGWLTAKKRGRDDEIIERDRRIAREQRQQQHQAARRKSKIVVNVVDEINITSSLENQGGTEEEKSSAKLNNHDAFVYPRQRQRQRISSQRELFPQEKSDGVKRKMERKGSNDLVCKRDKRKPQLKHKHNCVTLKQQSVTIIKRSSSMSSDRKRKIRVTPDKLDDLTLHKYGVATTNGTKDRNTRHRKNKVLFAENNDTLFSNPIVVQPSSTLKKKR